MKGRLMSGLFLFYYYLSCSAAEEVIAQDQKQGYQEKP